MKLLITGLNGTLAPRLAEAAQRAGWQVMAWDRQAVSTDDEDAGRRWLDAARPDAIAHLAMGSVAWSAGLAAFAAAHDLPFLFSSTAMVFHHQPDGPHATADPRNAVDDYGRYKIGCEDAVRSAHPAAMVVRIGWQIDATQPGNNMLCALDAWQQRDGHVAASRRWRPACSFMEDTAGAFVALLRSPRPGVFHYDSNAIEGHSFAQVVSALQRTFGRGHWQVRENDDHVHDQRLLGDELQPLPLARRLPSLAGLAPG